MTNIAKAITRLREERRDAQNQVQKLGEAISVLESYSRNGFNRKRWGRRIASSAFSPRPAAGEFLWLKKHVGPRYDRSKKPPSHRAGRRLTRPLSVDCRPPDRNSLTWLCFFLPHENLPVRSV